MLPDYIILAVVVALAIGGGAFLLHQAKNYRAQRRHHGD